MKKLLLSSLMLLSMFSLFGQSSVTWNGSADGVWNNSANWDGGVLPTNGVGDTLIINHDGGVPPIIPSSGTISLSQLIIKENSTLSITSDYFNTFTDTIFNNGTLTVDATRTLSANGKLANRSTGVSMSGAASMAGEWIPIIKGGVFAIFISMFFNNL